MLGTVSDAPVEAEVKEDSVGKKKFRRKKKSKGKESEAAEGISAQPKSKPSTPTAATIVPDRSKTPASRPTTASNSKTPPGTPIVSNGTNDSVGGPIVSNGTNDSVGGTEPKVMEKKKFGRGARIKGPIIAEMGPTKEILASMVTTKVSRTLPGLNNVKLTKRVVFPTQSKGESNFFRLRSESPPPAQKLAAPVLLAPLKLAGKQKK